MGTVNIPESDELTYKEFIEGNSVQVRAVATPGMEKDFQKGKKVRVAHLNMEGIGKIVSDPLTISDNRGAEEKVLSLIIEKD